MKTSPTSEAARPPTVLHARTPTEASGQGFISEKKPQMLNWMKNGNGHEKNLFLKFSLLFSSLEVSFLCYINSFILYNSTNSNKLLLFDSLYESVDSLLLLLYECKQANKQQQQKKTVLF